MQERMLREMHEKQSKPGLNVRLILDESGKDTGLQILPEYEKRKWLQLTVPRTNTISNVFNEVKLVTVEISFMNTTFVKLLVITSIANKLILQMFSNWKGCFQMRSSSTLEYIYSIGFVLHLSQGHINFCSLYCMWSSDWSFS